MIRTRLIRAAGLLLAVLAFQLPGSAAAVTIDLGPASGGWVAFSPLEGPDPRPYPCGGCPPITSSAPIFEGNNPNWNLVGYDDSSWLPYSGGWVPGDGSHTPFYLRNEFTIGAASSGNFSIIVDDDYRVWLNGTLILDDSNSGCCTLGNANLLPHLVEGTNVLAIKAENQPGGGYSISFNGAIEAQAFVAPAPAPMSSILLALGLAALSVTRRRERRETC